MVMKIYIYNFIFNDCTKNNGAFHKGKILLPSLFIWSHEWSCCKMANVCQVREKEKKEKN